MEQLSSIHRKLELSVVEIEANYDKKQILREATSPSAQTPHLHIGSTVFFQTFAAIFELGFT